MNIPKPAFFAALCLMLVIIGGAAYSLDMQVKENTQLKSKIASCEKELKEEKDASQLARTGKDLAEKAKEWQETRSQLLTAFALKISKSLDDMDTLVIQNDKDSFNLITWLKNACQFTINDGTLATANVKISRWDEKHDEGANDYVQLKLTIQNTLDDFKRAFSMQDSMKESPNVQ